MNESSAVIAVPTVETALSKAGDIAADGIASLRVAFAPHFDALPDLLQRARDVKPNEPWKARAVRLSLRQLRCAGEATREKLKADILLRGRAIDGMQHVLAYTTQPIETAMDEIEKAEERAEAARKVKLQQERADELRPYADPTHMDLASMGDDAWEMVLRGAKMAHEEKLAAAKREADERAERERIAQEQLAKKLEADRIERERVQAENQRLAKEAETLREEQRKREAAAEKERAIEREVQRQKDEAAAAERRKLAANAEAEKRKREAAEAEAKRLREEQEAKAKAEAAAKRKAARAPDKEKVTALAKAVRAIALPKFTSEDGAQVGAVIAEQIAKMAAWLETQAEKLS